MNDINGWLVDEDYDQDEVEDELDNFCWEVDEENKINSDPTEQCIPEDEVIGNIDDKEKQTLNPRFPSASALEKRIVKLDLLTDIDMVLMVEKFFGGRICHDIHRYVKADDDDNELFLWYGCLISSQDHCQRSSPWRNSDTQQAGFEPAQNLSSGVVE